MVQCTYSDSIIAQQGETESITSLNGAIFKSMLNVAQHGEIQIPVLHNMMK